MNITEQVCVKGGELSKTEMQNRVIRFMQYKSKVIERETGFSNYFVEADEKAIREWSKKDLQPILRIKTVDFCPFCLVYPCSKCVYAYTHGICRQSTSDYYYLTRILGVNTIASLYTPQDVKKLTNILKGEEDEKDIN